ncbi:FERM and PDZ domain-containing protein 2 [Vulpes lagopus]
MWSMYTMEYSSAIRKDEYPPFASTWMELEGIMLSEPFVHRGFVINEEEEVGKVDPGIFVSSIIPGGPAAKAKKLKPGGSICGNTPGKEKNNMANSGVFSTDSLSNGHQGSSLSHTQDRGKNSEELEVAQTQSLLPRERLQLPLPLKGIQPLLSRAPVQLLLLGMTGVPPEVVFCSRSCCVLGIEHHLAGVMCEATRKCLDCFSSPSDICILSGNRRGQGAGSSCPPPPSEINANEIYFVKLVK